MLRNQIDFDTVADCAVLNVHPRQQQMSCLDLSSGNSRSANNNGSGFSTHVSHSGSESGTNKLLSNGNNTDSGFFSGALSEDLNSQDSMKLDRNESGLDVSIQLADSFQTMTVKNCQNNLSDSTAIKQKYRQITLEDLIRQDEDGDTPLHLAVLQCYSEAVARLVSILPHPYLLDIPNKKFQTALHLAVLLNQPAIVRCLVVAGSSVESRDRNGNTPLHLACREGYIDCARALCFPVSQQERDSASLRHPYPVQSLPQDLEQRNYDGQMCVHLAAMCGSLPIVQLLSWAGANINATEAKSGRTALHYAVEGRRADLVQFLVTQCGAQVDAENYCGYTPYQIAAATAARIAMLLLNLGAQRRPVLDSSSSSDSESELSDEDLDYLSKWRPNKGQYLQALGEALLLV